MNLNHVGKSQIIANMIFTVVAAIALLKLLIKHTSTNLSAEILLSDYLMFRFHTLFVPLSSNLSFSL